MVLTNYEYQDAKSDPELSSLFKLRNATESYIIQCLADREIQYIVSEPQQRSKAFRYNCEVIHSPVEYNDVEAADDVGWNSTACKPTELHYFCRSDNWEKKLERQILIHQESIHHLKRENFRQSQKIQQLTVLVSDKEKTIAHWKGLLSNAQTRSRQMELCLNAKEKTILDLKESNKRWQSEFNKANGRKDADSIIKFRNLFICVGICLVAYTYRKSNNWIDFITFYSLSSLRKVYPFVHFLVDIPLNIVTRGM